MSDLLLNPEHWRHRAEEARALAEAMHDPNTRRIMLELAADFDELAERAEERHRSGNLPF